MIDDLTMLAIAVFGLLMLIAGIGVGIRIALARFRSPAHTISPRALAVATRLNVKRWGKERKAQALIPRVNRRG